MVMAGVSEDAKTATNLGNVTMWKAGGFLEGPLFRFTTGRSAARF